MLKGAVALLVAAAAAVVVLAHLSGTRRDVAAAHLVCAAAAQREALARLRDGYAPMGVRFGDRRGGTRVGYKRYFAVRWLCDVATGADGRIAHVAKVRAWSR